MTVRVICTLELNMVENVSFSFSLSSGFDAMIIEYVLIAD
jgi:hypothetical protein